MTIEPLTSSNAEHFARLTLELWPECNLTEELEASQGITTATNEIAYLAKADQEYIGFVHLTLRTDYVEGASASPTAYLEAVYVKPAWQKQGIAKQLINKGIVWAKTHGCHELASDTELHNATSINLHQHLGFTETNRIVCFIKTI